MSVGRPTIGATPTPPRAPPDDRLLDEILVDGESIYLAFKGIRDSVTFTSKRIVALNVQGMTGKKRDYTSLPYSRIQAFSVETAGTFDLDSEMELWFSGLGRIKLEFARGVDIRGLNRLIADHAL
ncbi:PH domain-containing protein [Georgenia phoenicis]|uniref:PH domain-containing protein n=1 Tax=unclassified Georgenia TaxID=2626815 RepID=UPI0039B0DB09